MDVGREASGPWLVASRWGGVLCRRVSFWGSTSAHLALCAGLHPPRVCRRVSFWEAHQRSLDYMFTKLAVRPHAGQAYRL